MTDTILLGLDVGGSSIKSALVDIQKGVSTTPSRRCGHPRRRRPRPCYLLRTNRSRLGASGRLGWRSLSVVKRGIARTAANVDQAWIGCAGGAAALAAHRPPGDLPQ